MRAIDFRLLLRCGLCKHQMPPAFYIESYLQPESQAALDNAQPSSMRSTQKDIQKKVNNLYSHMPSIYSVTRL